MIPKRFLLLIAALVWTVAGISVANIGIANYAKYFSVLTVLLSAAIFCIFWFAIFQRLVQKHVRRIHTKLADKEFFLKFFDLKSFIIMGVMMAFGFSLRSFQIVPGFFIAFFYTGLGIALALAGVNFAVRFALYNRDHTNLMQIEPSVAS